MKVRQAPQAFDKLGLEMREGRDTPAFFRGEGQVPLAYCEKSDYVV
jgi:hypothetical protein